MKTVFDGFGTAKKRVILVLSGIIAALPFCFSRLYILSWLFFGVLYTFIFAQKNGRVTTGSLFCFFYPFYAVLYSWFVNLYPLDFAGLGAFASVLVIIAALTLIPLIHSAVMAFSFLLCAFLTKPKNSVVSSLVFAFSYVFGELLQSVGSFAFPWGRLFVAQTQRLEIIQSASLFGSYFITFLIILVNALAANALFIKSGIKVRVFYGAAALLLFVSNFAYGALKLSDGYDTDGEITVCALQINMSSEQKWQNGMTDESLSRFEQICEKAVNERDRRGQSKIDLFVTPETSFPITLYSGDDLYSENAKKVDAELKDTAKKYDADVIAGAFYRDNGAYYNSLYLYGKDSSCSDVYNKQHLVPFGEFLPYRTALETVFGTAADLNLFGEDLTAGKMPETAPQTSNGIKFAGLVCFDSVFPTLCSKQVKNGAKLVIVSTNDSWYKTSAALDQHLKHSVMRAVENGVSVVRSANTGISALITPDGRIVRSLGANKYGSITATLPISSGTTLYSRTGDIINIAGIIFIFVLALYRFFSEKKVGD